MHFFCEKYKWTPGICCPSLAGISCGRCFVQLTTSFGYSIAGIHNIQSSLIWKIFNGSPVGTGLSPGYLLMSFRWCWNVYQIKGVWYAVCLVWSHTDVLSVAGCCVAWPLCSPSRLHSWPPTKPSRSRRRAPAMLPRNTWRTTRCCKRWKKKPHRVLSFSSSAGRKPVVRGHGSHCRHGDIW